jgi:hypothetical protein
MLKIFRMYMKYILPVAACGLMLIFVLEGSLMTLFGGGDPRQEVVGNDKTGPIRAADLGSAQSDLQVLQRMGLPVAIGGNDDPALLWTLLQRDAARLGLGSSSAEVSQAIRDMQLDDATIGKLADDAGATPAYIRQVIGDFLTYLRYARLMTGQPRLSEAAMRRLMHELLAKVQITAVQVSASQYADKVGEPTEAQINALFDEYKGDLPSESEPYGFGYKYPDRIKFEMLIIPGDKLLEKVRAERQVREIDAVEYYEQNKAQFTRDGEVAPYEGAVREQILAELRAAKAMALAKRMYQDAQDQLYQQYRQYDLVEGYRDLPADFTPMALGEVAEALQKRYDILPLIRRYDEAWRSDIEVMVVPYMLGAQTATDQPYSAIEYLFSARAFKPETTNPLSALRLQAKLPSLPIEFRDGSLLMVRLLDTSPEHEPASLDEVRDEVVADARSKAAYEALLADKATWEQRWAEATPEAVAEELKVSVLRPQPFARLVPDYSQMGGGGMVVPRLPVIGQNAAFVDAVCDLADQYEPGSQPRLVIPVSEARSLFLVQITSVQPGDQTEFDAYVSYGMADMMAERILLSSAESDMNPLSLVAISKRAGFTRPGATDE